MNEDEARKLLLRGVSVTRQKITIAKVFILKNFQESTTNLIEAFLRHMDAPMPRQVVLHESVDPQTSLKLAAESIAWRLAACEAIWSLIHTNLLLPASSHLQEEILSLGWTTVVPGSGGTSSGWKFPEFALAVPARVILPPSRSSSTEQPLTDADLYLHELGTVGVDPEVEDALREAVRCFRHELFTACLAMLGKASEGAWIELGLSLVEAFPKSTSLNVEKWKNTFADSFVGIGKKISGVLKLFERPELKPVSDRAGIKVQDLRNAVIWADQVRESRNSIHYGAKPAMSNSYEKVAALLIGAIPHMTIIYRLRATARQVAGDNHRKTQ